MLTVAQACKKRFLARPDDLPEHKLINSVIVLFYRVESASDLAVEVLTTIFDEIDDDRMSKFVPLLMAKTVDSLTTHQNDQTLNALLFFI